MNPIHVKALMSLAQDLDQAEKARNEREPPMTLEDQFRRVSEILKRGHERALKRNAAAQAKKTD